MEGHGNLCLSMKSKGEKVEVVLHQVTYAPDQNLFSFQAAAKKSHQSLGTNRDVECQTHHNSVHSVAFLYLRLGGEPAILPRRFCTRTQTFSCSEYERISQCVRTRPWGAVACDSEEPWGGVDGRIQSVYRVLMVKRFEKVSTVCNNATSRYSGAGARW